MEKTSVLWPGSFSTLSISIIADWAGRYATSE